MQSDASLAWVIAGALAIHVLAAVVGDILVVTHPPVPPEPESRVELVDVEVPKVVKPPAPPPPVKHEEPPPEEPVARPATPVQNRAPEPATPPTPEPPDPTNHAPGGAPVVALDNIDPSLSGNVLVAKGKRNTSAIGHGGGGGGTGAGQGSGSAAAAPVSVATIKKRALPKGDYDYFDAGKDYPAEARQLGIEGAIRVRLVVDATGKVTQAVLLNRLGHGLDELALARARAIEFEAALDTEDRAVTSVVVWTFNMTLPK